MSDAKDKDLLSQLPVLDEKKTSSDSDVAIGKDSHSERVSFVEGDALGEALYVNGEPVVQDGRDVSRFVIDLRDDGDEALTFRGLVLGTIFGGLRAALCQVCSRDSISFTLSADVPRRYTVRILKLIMAVIERLTRLISVL